MIKRTVMEVIITNLTNFDPDTGVSSWTDIDLINRALTIEGHSPATGNGGASIRSNAGTLGTKYNVERDKKGGRIVAMRLDGFNTHFQGKSSVPSCVSKAMHEQNIRCVITASTTFEVDHKDGRFDANTTAANSKDMKDYQPLSRCANATKREVCNKCKKSDLRFDAKKLGYKKGWYQGTQAYQRSGLGCIGCYWYDPLAFRKSL